MRKPDWQKGDVRLWCGDCVQLLAAMPDAGVDCTIMDPPYGVDLNYGKAFDDSEEYYATNVVPAIQAAIRVTSGPVLAFGAAPTMRRDLLLLPAVGRILIWSPRFTLSQSRKSGIRFRWHPCYCWNLPAKHEGPKWDILDVACDGHNWWNHPATKPFELMRQLVGFCPKDGTILDCYAGSGTTGVAAVRMGRKFIGIEIEPKYFDIAVRRIADEMNTLF